MVKNNSNSSRILFFLLSFLILQLSAAGGFFTANATVRYVSHNGSNTPPYTTWETAADSIMSAINISVFGDTIYVANGVYEEQVIMIPGLTLIGAGMDSCLIDTRSMVTPSFWAVSVVDSCVFENFKILVSNSRMGGGIRAEPGLVKIKFNLILNTSLSCIVNNSNVLIDNNIMIETDEAMFILGLLFPTNPIISSNYFGVKNIGISVDIGISLKPEIYNNIIVLKDDGAGAYGGGFSDTVKIFNNLIIAEGSQPHSKGISATGVPHIVRNNLIIGDIKSGISTTSLNSHLVQITNNLIMNARYGIDNSTGTNVTAYYNNAWNNQDSYHDFEPDSTNLSVDPMIANEDTTLGELDFHLQMFSPLIDAGDPNILDVNGSRSDIGLYGGQFGESYTYQDLAPRSPRNLTADYDSIKVRVKWNRNTEADFNHYNLFRDTTANFTADSTTFVIGLTDTFYQHIIPPVTDAFYYKLTATDNQGNESLPSEELAVIITSVNEYPSTVSNYQLYQNYPNPFNPSTKIAYKLKERGYVKLMVYDIKGELVRVLVNEYQTSGYYEVEFRPNRSERGKGKLGLDWATGYNDDIASGIYIYQIMVKSDRNIPVFTDMNKMILLK